MEIKITAQAQVLLIFIPSVVTISFACGLEEPLFSLCRLRKIKFEACFVAHAREIKKKGTVETESDKARGRDRDLD